MYSLKVWNFSGFVIFLSLKCNEFWINFFTLVDLIIIYIKNFCPKFFNTFKSYFQFFLKKSSYIEDEFHLPTPLVYGIDSLHAFGHIYSRGADVSKWKFFV
jgi:hypothetical protein